MKRISEGWWAMLVVCVSSGLWLVVVPLLGYGLVFDGIFVRPAWLGVPAFVFGAVYAARSTRCGAVSGVVCGALLFLTTYACGVQFAVMRASHLVACHVQERQDSCASIRHFEERGRDWSPAAAASSLGAPADSRTFIEVVR